MTYKTEITSYKTEITVIFLG